MTLSQYIQTNGLKVADAIILRKKFLGMVDHYAIFMGFKNDNPVFVANYREGVKEVSKSEMYSLLKSLEPVKIEPFSGSEAERLKAIKRAEMRIGEKAYNYISNNCEHFKNWVHYGINSSSQVKKASNISIGIAVGLGVATLLTKKPKYAVLAYGLLLFGLALKAASENE